MGSVPFCARIERTEIPMQADCSHPALRREGEEWPTASYLGSGIAASCHGRMRCLIWPSSVRPPPPLVHVLVDKPPLSCQCQGDGLGGRPRGLEACWPERPYSVVLERQRASKPVRLWRGFPARAVTHCFTGRRLRSAASTSFAISKRQSIATRIHSSIHRPCTPPSPTPLCSLPSSALLIHTFLPSATHLILRAYLFISPCSAFDSPFPPPNSQALQTDRYRDRHSGRDPNLKRCAP
jgi:hypothetical protein